MDIYNPSTATSSANSSSQGTHRSAQPHSTEPLAYRSRQNSDAGRRECSAPLTQLPVPRRASERFGRAHLIREGGPPTETGDDEEFYHAVPYHPLEQPPRAMAHDPRQLGEQQHRQSASWGQSINPFAGFFTANGEVPPPPNPNLPGYDHRGSAPPSFDSMRGANVDFPGYSNLPPPGGDRRASNPAEFFSRGMDRTTTDEQLRTLATRQAADLVNSHLNGNFDRPVNDRRGSQAPPRPQQRLDPDDDGRATRERATAGILSNLLQLYGANLTAAGGLNRTPSNVTTSSAGGGDQKWAKMGHRSNSIADEGAYARRVNVALPPLTRSDSHSTAATHFDDPDAPKEKIEKSDKRAKKPKEKAADGHSADDHRHEDGVPVEKVKGQSKTDQEQEAAHRAAAKMLAKSGGLNEDDVYEALRQSYAANGSSKDKKNKYRKMKHKMAITAHVATIIERQAFILKLAKALMTFGAPSHRLESQLNATASVLQVDAQFIHVPSVVIASFGDSDTHTSETKFVKASGGLNLGCLHKVHAIYRDVIHDEISVEEGSVALSKLLKTQPIYNLWQRMLIAAMCAGIIAPMGFGGSFIDAFVSGAFGATLAFLQLYVARKNAIFSNIFEISVAALISFVSRGLSTTNLFCYEALSSAGVVLVLPGYVILCGSLELASRNLIAGSVRMVYAIIYTLFLGFAISVGSEVFFLFDPASRHAFDATMAQTTVAIDGTFTANNATGMMWTGSWVFTNSSSGAGTSQASLQTGNIMCVRDSSWEWWRQDVSVYWLILLVPAFSLFLSLWNLQPIRSRELPVMCFISVIGYIANRVATIYIFERSDIVSFIGATVIGLLGNLYSRLFNGTAFTAMATGVLFLVPSGIAAAGGLAMSGAGGDQYTSGLEIGFRMVEVAIGITIGLFFSSFLIYSVGTKRTNGGLGFAF